MKAGATVNRFLITTALVVCCVVFAFPFVWMFFSTFKTSYEIFSPLQILPNSFNIQYYRELLGGEWIPFTRQYFNSLFIAFMQTLLAIALSLTTGFVLGRYRFPLRRLFAIFAIMVILIPRQVMVLPLFVWQNRLGILDTPFSVILPGMISGIGVIYFTQVFRNLPAELFDLLRVEGASEYRGFFLVLPLVKPALLTYGLIHFLLAWHEHIVPLVMLSSPEKLTVTVSLASLAGTGRVPYALLMAGSTFLIIPIVILFIGLFRHFKTSLADLTAH